MVVKIQKEKGEIETRIAYEVLVEEMNKRETLPEFKIALIGESSVGKSSLVSVLTQSILDDSNGRARLSLGFRHRHELISGHTSSISREIYGYDHANNILNYSGKINLDDGYQTSSNELLDDDLLNNSKYLVSLLDSGGNKKHLSTTIYGLNQCNFAFLVIDSNTIDLIGTSKDHLNILLTLNLPFLIIINKIDLVSQAECSNLIQNLRGHLKNKSLKMIENETDIENYFNDQKIDLLNSNEITNIPLIKLSCVTGQSIGIIYRFVNQFILQTRNVFDSLRYNGTRVSPLDFLIQDVFYENEETCVLGGLLSNGQLNKNDRVLIGPISNDQFIECKILSIERYKTSLKSLKETESGSLEIEFMNKENLNMQSLDMGKMKDKKIRKGMTIISMDTNLSTIKVGRKFKVKLKLSYLLKNAIRKGFQAKIFIDNIKQTVCVVDIEGHDEITSIGEYLVVLRFVKKPEVLRLGSRFFLWQEDKLQATGIVIDYDL